MEDVNLLDPSATVLENPHEVQRMVSVMQEAYPQCDGEVLRLFDLLQRNTGGLVESKLSDLRVDLLWCVLSSHCPSEAARYTECALPRLPPTVRSRPALLLNRATPRECRSQWRAFDECLIAKTEEFERNNRPS